MQQTLIWAAVILLVAVIFVPYLLKFRKGQKVIAHRREEARAMGIDRPRAQFPLIDRSQCIGCGSCVMACPEGDVLGVVWGVAEVLNGDRCVGHGHCEQACPVGAIKVGLGDIKSRPDIPVLSPELETTVPGLFIAGELGGLSLIRNAISQGQRATEEVARRVGRTKSDDIYDIIIVGAGPAGLSAALTAVKHGLNYLVLEESDIGGTIAQYPRRKLVMTQPVELPLYGWLKREEYSKEMLLETWREITGRFQLRINAGQRMESLLRKDNLFSITTPVSTYLARYVVLAIGRRGIPRRLNVSGEELPKVMYRLIDAQSYTNSHLLVVGGGDSAVEAAVGLARQKGNSVTISYRKSAFTKVKKKNEDAAIRLIREQKLTALFDSEVQQIQSASVSLRTQGDIIELPNDFVLIQIGGVPPFEMLTQMGIAFGGDVLPLL